MKKLFLILSLASSFVLCSCNESDIGWSFDMGQVVHPSNNNSSDDDRTEDTINSDTAKSDSKNTETSNSDSGKDTASDSKDSSSDSSDTTTPDNPSDHRYTDPTSNKYYKNVDLSLTKADLKTSLYKTINKHTSLGYSNLYSIYKDSDVRADGTIWDMYSNQHFKTSQNNGSYSKEGDMYNREHTIPQSIFNKANPMVCDAFHVYPTDGYVNNRRSNYPHAEVSRTKITFKSSNNTLVGSSATQGVSGSVCEPADEYKGDFARTYFYFVTCYQDKLSSFKSYAPFSQNSYPSLSQWAIKLYLKWSREDPVSEKEINRNNAVYNRQGNRNPFIDFPGIEEVIWNA